MSDIDTRACWEDSTVFYRGFLRQQQHNGLGMQRHIARGWNGIQKKRAEKKGKGKENAEKGLEKQVD